MTWYHLLATATTTGRRLTNAEITVFGLFFTSFVTIVVAIVQRGKQNDHDTAKRSEWLQQELDVVTRDRDRLQALLDRPPGHGSTSSP